MPDAFLQRRSISTLSDLGAFRQHKLRSRVRRTEVPELFYIVIAGRTLDLVDDHDQIRLLKLDAAAMNEAVIPAFCFQKIALGIRFPRQNRYLGRSPATATAA